jgi:uncharacterized protein YukE
MQALEYASSAIKQISNMMAQAEQEASTRFKF